MKSKVIIRAIISSLLILGISGVILQHHFKNSSNPDENKENLSNSSASNNNLEITPVQITEALSENPEIENYVLRYDPDSRMVLLTTRYKDGSELISNIKSINPEFLEPEDVQALITGIEFFSKEDMFKLIEDYSS